RAGASRQLTEDHAGSFAHGITRFVGDPRGVQADVFVETLLPGDRLLLCSDGLTRHVADEEIAARAGGGDVERAASDLVALANSRGGEDNVTVVLYAARPRAILAFPRRVVAFVTFLALVALVVVGAFAVLFSLAPYVPAPSAPVASASPASTPTPSPSPTPTPTEPLTPSPAPSPTESPMPTPTP
ncbi:MAG TPA: hypothetical protein VJQ09_07030, partial [Candidatus Limnocylindria bacterium]|nr:hypothetical protein [Candidatus Limnocylindria bacterium]